MSKRKLAWFLGAVLVVGGLAVGTVFRLQQKGAAQTQNAAKLKATAEETVAVEVAPVTLGDVVEETKVNGTVRPLHDVGVVSKLPGRVRRVLVDVGDSVKAGEVLVELDRDELAAQVRQAEAAVIAARAGARQTVTGARTQVETSTGQYDSAQAMLKQAQVNLKSATDNLVRMQGLYAKRAVTRQQLELAETQAEVARAQVQSAQAAVDSAKSALEGAERHLSTVQEVSPMAGGARTPTAAEAAVVQAEAALELARTQLANAVITAPFSGVVSFRNIDPGELASPGVPLIGLVSLDRLYVEVSLTEELMGKVREGTAVKVQVDAFPGRMFAGRLANLAPSADPRTKAYTARAYLPNPGLELRPGMFATVSLATQQHHGVVAVPSGAVVDRNGTPVVYVVEKGRAVERAVVLGLRNGKVTEITSGLQPGEQLIVRGQLQMSDGVAVRPAPAAGEGGQA